VDLKHNIRDEVAAFSPKVRDHVSRLNTAPTIINIKGPAEKPDDF
jgi:hypothetical protein